MQIKWKGNKFEQTIIKKAEHSLICKRVKCTNIKNNCLQTEIANTKTSLQQKLDAPTFTDLQNVIFNNKEKTFPPYKNTKTQEAQRPHFQILHNILQDGLQDNQHFQHCCHFLYLLMYQGQMGNQPLQERTNIQREVFTTEWPKICSYPSNHPHQVIHLHYYCGSSPGR